MSLLSLEPGLLDPDATVFIVTPLCFPPNKYQDLLLLIKAVLYGISTINKKCSLNIQLLESAIFIFR